MGTKDFWVVPLPSTVPQPTAIILLIAKTPLTLWTCGFHNLPRCNLSEESTVKMQSKQGLELPLRLPPQKTNMSMENPTMNEDVLKMVIFQCLVFSGVYTLQYTQ